MRIRKLLSVLALLAVPCILSSCSFQKAKSTESETTSEIQREDIDYHDTVVMNGIYDSSLEGQFENYICSFTIGETDSVSCNFNYQAEGGQKYAELYCDWSLEKLMSLKAVEYLETFRNYPRSSHVYFLTSTESEEMLNSCLDKMEVLINSGHPEEVPITMYITLKNHVRNIVPQSISFYYE